MRMEGGIDVIELCALLQCLGYTVKSLDTSDANLSQDGGGGALKTVVINCQQSGLHVVLESPAALCSCPPANLQNSGFWQVSGVTGGKQFDKESGSNLLCTLPKTHRERFTRELSEMVKHIKEHGDEQGVKDMGNRSASMVELKTPEKSLNQIKMDTPTRYRSLDTLTTTRDGQALPPPGSLQKKTNISSEDVKLEQGEHRKIVMCRRQSTYTIPSTPGSVNRIRNKTSSPIQAPHNSLVEGLLAAEKTAEDLRNILSNMLKEFIDDGNESSMSSLALDVSKISVLKGIDPRSQFASSPNLSGLAAINDDFKNGRLRRLDSASTSNLVTGKPTPKDSKTSRLRRISPKIFRLGKESPATVKVDKSNTQDKRGKLSCLFKPKIATPVRVPKTAADISSSMSASKKKFSHVKSTIPRPTPRKE